MCGIVSVSTVFLCRRLLMVLLIFEIHIPLVYCYLSSIIFYLTFITSIGFFYITRILRIVMIFEIPSTNSWDVISTDGLGITRYYI